MTDADVVSMTGVSRTFVGSRRPGRASEVVRAVDDVSLQVAAGEVLGIVGESGAGKSTIARLILGLEQPDEGQTRFLGQDLWAGSAEDRRRLRRRIHLVFQDPYQSLHPGMRVRELVAEPLMIAGVKSDEATPAVRVALEETGMGPADTFLSRYPHELSGGQRQRVALARAIVGGPELIVADEPTSMLDASLCAGILELLLGIRERHNTAIVYITHNLAVARYVCDRIMVMKSGRVVEHGDADQVIDHPRDPYTQLLIAASEGRLDDVRRLEAEARIRTQEPAVTSPDHRAPQQQESA